MKAIQYNLKDVKTADEALESAQLNWEACPQNILTESGVSIPDHRAILRSDNNFPIGMVGSRYLPLQNSFAFSFFDTVCQQHDAKYEKAYVVDGGHKVILEATVNGPITIRKNDEILRKIRLINTFDGSSPFLVQFSIWRLICKNGLMGWAKENKCRVTHTKNAESRAGEALRILAISIQYFEKFEAQCKLLAQKIMDKKMVDKFIKECFGEKGSKRQENQINKVLELYEAGSGTGKGTLWDMTNAFCEWMDHFRSADEETRLANSIVGSASIKEHSFDVACSLI
jgi:phage/plasmid-like protein (TIGR03299 family)